MYVTNKNNTCFEDLILQDKTPQGLSSRRPCIHEDDLQAVIDQARRGG